MKYLVFTFLSIVILSMAGFFIWRTQNSTYTLSFSANGVVEKADYKNDRCVVKVAIYEWVNLSGDFKIADIPQRSDRYLIQGQGEACQALPIAMSTTNQHISFEIGYIKNQWTFIKNPNAALSCGGLNINWIPDPEN